MRSPSPSKTSRGRHARRGFSLVELLIAAGLGVTVMTIGINAYLGANKVQALAVGGSLLKQSAEQGLDELFRQLKGSRKIFDAAQAAEWVKRLDLLSPWNVGGTVTPAIEANDLMFPTIQPKAQFYVQDLAASQNPNFDRTKMGNALMFASLEPRALVKDPLAPPQPQTDTFGDPDHQFSAYRLHLYFLARRSLGTLKSVRPGSSFTYQLMHWQSLPFLDYQELQDWMSDMKTRTPALNPAPDAFITTKLLKMRDSADGGTGPYAGALNLQASDAAMTVTASPAYYRLAAASGYLDLVRNSTRRFENAAYRSALQFNARNSFVECMVAFNTSAPFDGSFPAVPLPAVASLQENVPGYAPLNTNKPYGFEVAIGGPGSGRQVLLRLALASRSHSGGRNLTGYVFQKVVQVSEY